MCGIIGWKGKISELVIDKLIEQSEVRGMHHVGEIRERNSGLIHCRYITSGETNQPLFVPTTWLVFNGVIDMGTKKEIEKRWKIKMKTDNDGEIFLQLCKAHVDMMRLISDPAVSFAGIMLDYNGKLKAIRNERRPLWMWKKDRTVILASTKDILVRSGLSYQFASELKPYKLYEW